MEKTFDFGKVDFDGVGANKNKVKVKIELQEKEKGKPVFSAVGEIWNKYESDIEIGGQCLDEIKKYLKNDSVFNEIYRLWKLYHLNDMNACCEHQKTFGWEERAKEKVKLYHWDLKSDISSQQKKIKRDIIDSIKKFCFASISPEEQYILNLKYEMTTITRLLPSEFEKYYAPRKEKNYNGYGHIEEKTLGWLKLEEHPEGILGKACPICGHKYGTFIYIPIPDKDLQIIKNLIKNGTI